MAVAMSQATSSRSRAETELLARVRAAARQEQFLEVVSPEEARARFSRRIDLSPLAAESVRLVDALGRVLAHDVVALADAPPFDRSNVDGFAVRALDTLGASDSRPKVLMLNAEVIACGHAPMLDVGGATATAVATGGIIPRGAVRSPARLLTRSRRAFRSGPRRRRRVGSCRRWRWSLRCPARR
jgi:putative molybdopterin biosynthesis protein